MFKNKSLVFYNLFSITIIMINSEKKIPTLCNLTDDWFEREKGEKMFYFIDDDLNPRVSKFKKSKENITYNLENKKRTFEIKPRKGKKSKKTRIKKIFKNLKKSLKKRVDASILENIIDDFGGNRINLKKLSGSVRRKISKKYCTVSASKSSDKTTRKTKKKRRSLFDYLPKLRRSVDKRQNILQPQLQPQQNSRNTQIKILQQQISNLKQEMKKNNRKAESKDNTQNKKSDKEIKMQQEINALKQILEKGEKDRQISKNDMQAYKEKLEYKRKLKSELENERKRMKEELYRRESKQNKKLREYQRRMNEIQDKERERKLESKFKGKYKELLMQAEQNKNRAERTPNVKK